MVLNRLVLLGRAPRHVLGVFRANAVRPRQAVIDLQEVVVPEDGLLGPEAAEEVHHALLELFTELRDVAGGVDLGERHAEFVGQPPEASEQDGAAEQVTLAVGLLEHQGQVVLYEACAGRDGVFGKGVRSDVEGLAGEEVVDASTRAAEEAGIALGQVVGQLLEELDSRRVRLWCGHTAFVSALCDSARLVGMEAWVMVVELDPVVPFHGAETHGDEVLWAVAEWAVGERGGVMDGPVGVGLCGWSSERGNCPLPWRSRDGLEFG